MKDIHVPWLVDGHQFLHSVTLYEGPGILWAVCNNLMNSV